MLSPRGRPVGKGIEGRRTNWRAEMIELALEPVEALAPTWPLVVLAFGAIAAFILSHFFP